MAKPFITDGMTVEEIINMPYEVKNSLDTREMRHALARVNNMANKRLDRLQKAVRSDNTLDKSSAGVPRFKTPGKLNEMRKELKRAKDFINAQTSTITGARKSMLEKQARVTNMNPNDYKKKLDHELNELQKNERRKALNEKRKNDKKHKDKRKVKLTEKQKQKINEKTKKEFYKKLNKKMTEIYELFNKYKELNPSGAYVKGSPIVLQISHDVYEEKPDLNTMEKIKEIERRLKNEYEKLQEEQNKRDKQAAEKFAFVSPLY